MATDRSPADGVPTEEGIDPGSRVGVIGCAKPDALGVLAPGEALRLTVRITIERVSLSA